MTDTETTIKLKYQRVDFENIYFKNYQGNIFFSSAIKQQFVILLVFVSLFLISLIYFLYTTLLWGLPIFFLCLLALSFSSYWRNASPIINWKKQVIMFLDGLDKISHNEITLTKSTLMVIQDDEVIITKWIVFTKVIFNEESIRLIGNDEYLFPKKSMAISEYAYLKNFITDRIKNEL